MKKILAIISVMLAIAAFYFLGKYTLEEREFISWISKNSLPIDTVDPVKDFSDLKNIKELLRDKQVVAFGEATHGTKEFFQMKARMFRFLVEELGFTVFAIEASHSRCKYINEFIATGKGDLDTATVIQGFTTWSTAEFKGLIKWMRMYNTNRTTGKIRFVGFDLLVNDAGIQSISKYISRVDPSEIGEADSLLTAIRKEEKRMGILSGDTTCRTLIKPIGHFLSSFMVKKEFYQGKTSPAEYEEVLNDIIVLQQFVIAMSYNAWVDTSIRETRDYFMARNILAAQVSFPSEKIFVWAHNGHIAKDFLDGTTYPSMGSFLKQALQNKYYAIGFDFYRGKFRADDPALKDSPGWEEHELGNAPVGNMGYYFNEAIKTNAFIDFTQPSKSKIIEKWLLDKDLRMYSVGAQFSESWYAKYYYSSWVRLYRAFDAIIFIRESHKAVPVPSLLIDRYSIGKNS